MANPSYATATTIKAWTNPNYGANRLYAVTPYKTGNSVSADALTNLTEDQAEDAFQQMVTNAISGAKDYDQVVVTEQLVVCPS